MQFSGFCRRGFMMRRAFLRAAASGAAATIRRRPPAQAPLRSLPPCMEGPLQRVGTSRAASSSAHHPSEQVSARGSSLVPPYLCNQRLFIYQQPSWWGPTLVAFGTLCMGVGAVVLAVEPARGIMSQESNPQKVRMWNPLRKKGACSLALLTQNCRCFTHFALETTSFPKRRQKPTSTARCRCNS